MENITKKLNITDVERKLVLPENCLEDLRSDLEANLKFKDEEGRVWTFRCRASPGGRSKPALYGDWFSFVRAKGLVVGDVIVIISDKEKNIAAGGYFKIKIKKSASKRNQKERSGAVSSLSHRSIYILGLLELITSKICSSMGLSCKSREDRIF